MNIPLRLTLAALVAWAAPHLALASPIHLEWGVVESDCVVPPGVLTFSCGSYGQLLVGAQDGTQCTYVAGATETVQVYTQPSRLRAVTTVPLPPGGPITPLAAKADTSPTAPDSVEEPPVPCNQGLCFSSPTGLGNDPWVAVFDWNNWHGWTMGAAVQLLSGRPVSLFALDSPSVTQTLGMTINDGHVLATVCSLAELVENGDATPPAVVNLSFGRKPLDSELSPARDCNPNSISCQIRHVLEHLKQLGTVFVGSAGNHGSMLFPAGVETVISTGTLDMAAFRWGRAIAPTWESPPDAGALAPGYGLCLEFQEGDEVGQLWPAPPGSSYSAAVLAGWILDGVASDSLPSTLGGTIHPVWSSKLGCFVLSEDQNPRCNPVANQMLQQMLGQTSQTCWSQSFVQPFLTIQGPYSQLPNGLGIPSIEDWVSTSHNPAPSSNFCVPCVSGGGWELTGPGGGGKEESFGSYVAAADTGHGNFIFDISASGSAGGGETLEGLYLRVEDDFFALLERSAGQGDLLDGLTEGTYRRLIVENFASLIPSRSTQPSLVYVLSPEGSSAQFWTSTPVLLSAPAGRDLGGNP